MSNILLNETAAPGTPASAKVIIYAKSDGFLYWKDDAGTEYPVTAPTLTQTLSNKTLASPAISGTVTGTYTIAGAPSQSSNISYTSVNIQYTGATATAGAVVTQTLDSNSRTILAMYGGIDTTAYNGANTAVGIRQVGGTGRSVNAAGTVNASGADYAEYEKKRTDCGIIAPGDVVGFDAHGLLTDKWSLAVTFGIKSTRPSYVGGDAWGLPESICPLDGAAIGEPPVTPKVPSAEASREEVERAATAIRDFTQNRTQWEARFEAARATVDRIAYAGKVPVNVFGATVGQWIVPQVGPGDTIVGISQEAFSPEALGKVRRILADGRAEVVV